MKHMGLACLSLTTNLRCVGFTLAQFATLIVPPAIEAILSTLFICLYPGPCRWAQILLVLDTLLYFIWALLDMVSHVVPAARNSLSVFETLDVFVGAVSFTPILVYSIYVYHLSFHDFIPTLPRSLQPYLEYSLPTLIVIVVALNEVSSFFGMHLGTTHNGQVVVDFPYNNESLWLSLSQSSLAIYAIIQFLFLLLAFSRLSKAFLNQRRIELAHSDECHFLNGIIWINAGIILGLAETVTGFASVSFSMALARRILRLVSRATLMFGMLKGLDLAENFEELVDELRGVSRIRNPVSRMLGVYPRRTSVFRQTPQTRSEHSQTDEERSLAEKSDRNQRVTICYEEGQAPFLMIRFSALELPIQAVYADAIQQRRRSLPGLLERSDLGHNTSDEMAMARSAVLDTPRAKSVFLASCSSHHIPYDWIRPPELGHRRQGSGGTISDHLSVVRDLERKFPNLPPRVTGKYRGSILGENYEEDPFPVVCISRQSSLRTQNPSEEGAALSPSSSIKRKPAPPLLDNIAYISDQRKRPASSWGGLSKNMVNRSPDSPMVPNSPWANTTVYGSDHGLIKEPIKEPVIATTPKPRRRTARDFIKRASRALSDASMRSAEWFASASAPSSTQMPLIVTDIEMYRDGSFDPGSIRPKPKPSVAAARSSSDNPVPRGSSRSAEDTRALSPDRDSSVKVSTQTTPTLTPFEPGSEGVESST